jgi:prevent-host-death family protein
MESVGIRELRQHASRYIQRVAAGETIEVTDRGRRVAMLVPARSAGRSALLASGKLRPARSRAELPAPVAPKRGAVKASEALRRMREAER